jgi:hypothetical protein
VVAGFEISSIRVKLRGGGHLASVQICSGSGFSYLPEASISNAAVTLRFAEELWNDSMSSNGKCVFFLALLAVAALPANAGSPEDVHECIRTLAIKFTDMHTADTIDDHPFSAQEQAIERYESTMM